MVEEMDRKFREDPSSVDPSWHEFLVDYSPERIQRERTDTFAMRLFTWSAGAKRHAE